MFSTLHEIKQTSARKKGEEKVKALDFSQGILEEDQEFLEFELRDGRE